MIFKQSPLQKLGEERSAHSVGERLSPRCLLCLTQFNPMSRPRTQLAVFLFYKPRNSSLLQLTKLRLFQIKLIPEDIFFHRTCTFVINVDRGEISSGMWRYHVKGKQNGQSLGCPHRTSLKNRMLCETTHLEHNISTRLDDFFYQLLTTTTTEVGQIE